MAMTRLARGSRGFLGAMIALLDGHRGLAGATAEVVKAGLHRLGLALDLDLLDVRGVNRKYALDTFAVTDAAHGEGLVDAIAFAGDDDAGENLDALFVAFAYFSVNADAVANLEGSLVGLHLSGGDFFNDRIHVWFI